MTGDRVLATTAEILRRPTEYFRILRKHQGGRQSTRCYGMKYYNGRQSTRCDRIKYFDGRQSTCHNCGNTLTADRVLYPVAAYPFLARIGYASKKYAKSAAHTMPRLRMNSLSEKRQVFYASMWKNIKLLLGKTGFSSSNNNQRVV